MHRAMARKPKCILQCSCTHTSGMQQVHRSYMRVCGRQVHSRACHCVHGILSLSLSLSPIFSLHALLIIAFSSLTIPRTSCHIGAWRATVFFVRLTERVSAGAGLRFKFGREKNCRLFSSFIARIVD